MTLITKRIIISGLTMATIFRKEKGGIYDNDKGYHYRRLCTTAFYLRKKKKKLERAPWPGNFFFFFKVTKVWLYAGYHDQCGSYLDADV